MCLDFSGLFWRVLMQHQQHQLVCLHQGRSLGALQWVMGSLRNPWEEWPHPAASYTYQVVLTCNSFSTIPLKSNGEFMTKSYLLSLSGDISIAQKNIWSLRKQTQEIDIWFSCSQTIALILSSRVQRARPNISYGKPAVQCSFSCQIEGSPQDVFVESALKKQISVLAVVSPLLHKHPCIFKKPEG